MLLGDLNTVAWVTQTLRHCWLLVLLLQGHLQTAMDWEELLSGVEDEEPG